MKNQLTLALERFLQSLLVITYGNTTLNLPCLYNLHLIHGLCIIVFVNSKVFRYISSLKPTFMNLIERAKNIIIAPAKEWDVIATETPDTGKIITGYVLPLAGAAALAAFIGYGLIGVSYFGVRAGGINWGIYQAISVLVGALAGVFVSALVIDALAPSFGSEKNMGRSVQLVAYSYTPGWVGGLLAILPAIAIIGTLAGLYGLYLLYIGMPKLKKTPPDKHVGYFVVSLLVIIVVYFIVGLIMSRILMPSMGLYYGGSSINLNY
ncbi:MAG: YIP1 family protein [Ferruginibacter sp.]|nr:YIP1 family protein [Ferruginibacter sp.]